MIVIECREQILVNTDSQRRCYNGCNFSEELRWTDWEQLDFPREGMAEVRLIFWRELNDYAVSQRGKSARKEFRIVEDS
jgi:hypothetical protein